MLFLIVGCNLFFLMIHSYINFVITYVINDNYLIYMYNNLKKKNTYNSNKTYNSLILYPTLSSIVASASLPHPISESAFFFKC